MRYESLGWEDRRWCRRRDKEKRNGGWGLLKERLISVSAVLMLVVTSLTHPSIYPTLKCRSDVCTHFLVFILCRFASQLHVTQESDLSILRIWDKLNMPKFQKHLFPHNICTGPLTSTGLTTELNTTTHNFNDFTERMDECKDDVLSDRRRFGRRRHGWTNKIILKIWMKFYIENLKYVRQNINATVAIPCDVEL
jgi:hypothetical protein